MVSVFYYLYFLFTLLFTFFLFRSLTQNAQGAPDALAGFDQVVFKKVIHFLVEIFLFRRV